jgi:hypothetical protein
MMEAVRTSETSVNFNVTTRRYIPEDSKLQTRRRQKLKSHIILPYFILAFLLLIRFILCTFPSHFCSKINLCSPSASSVFPSDYCFVFPLHFSSLFSSLNFIPICLLLPSLSAFVRGEVMGHLASILRLEGPRKIRNPTRTLALAEMLLQCDPKIAITVVKAECRD